MAFDLNRTFIQMRTWFRYFMMLGTLVDVRTGNKMYTGNGDTGYEEVRTCMTDGKIIMINPDWLGGFASPEQNFVVCRMIMAVARRQHLMRYDRDQQLWDIACEQVILNELLKYKQFLDKTKSIAPFEIPGDIHIETSFDGMSEAEIYEHLRQGGKSNLRSKQGKQGKSDGGQCGSVRDGVNSRNPAASRAESRKIANILRSAEVQSKLAGKGNTFWGCLADDANSVGPDPEQLLHRFVTNSLPTGRSWKRPDMRIYSMGQYYPGEIKYNIGELACFIDCSGSMCSNTVSETLGWVRNAVQSCKPEKIHVVYFTAEISRVDVFRWSEVFVIPRKIPNGGTDFKRAMKYLDDKRPKAAIWLTDGYDTFPEEPVGIPTLWLMTTDVKAPYGETIRFYPEKV